MDNILEFTMISSEELDTLHQSDKLELSKLCEQYSNSTRHQSFEIDSLWNAFHFFFTSEPVEEALDGDLLSAAICGIDLLLNDATTKISTIAHIDLNAIVNSLKYVDLEELRNDFDLDNYTYHEIIPHVDSLKDLDSLLRDLTLIYDDLLDFFDKALSQDLNIVITLY